MTPLHLIRMPVNLVALNRIGEIRDLTRRSVT